MIKQTTYLTISNLVTRILSLVFFVLLARLYSVEEYGLLRYLITIAGLLFVFINFYPTTLTKFISYSKKYKDRFFSNVLLITIIIYIILAVIITLFIENSLLVLILLFGLSYDAIYFALIRGDLDFKKLAVFKSSANLFKIILLVISFLVFTKVAILTAVIIFSFSSVLSIILLELHTRTKIRFSYKLISKKTIKALTTYALPILLGSVSYDLMFNIDTIFIKHFLSNLEVGYYSVARTINQIFTFLPLAIGTILMPHVSKLKNRAESIKKLKLLLKITFGTSILTFVFLLIFSKLIISVVFTDKYLPSLNAVYILAIGQVFFMSYILYEAVWQGFNKPKIPSLIILVVSILNIIGNFVLIPIYGLIGAAISTAITSFIAFLISTIVFYKNEIKQTSTN